MCGTFFEEWEVGHHQLKVLLLWCQILEAYDVGRTFLEEWEVGHQ